MDHFIINDTMSAINDMSLNISRAFEDIDTLRDIQNISQSNSLNKTNTELTKIAVESIANRLGISNINISLEDSNNTGIGATLLNIITKVFTSILNGLLWLKDMFMKLFNSLFGNKNNGIEETNKKVNDSEAIDAIVEEALKNKAHLKEVFDTVNKVIDDLANGGDKKTKHADEALAEAMNKLREEWSGTNKSLQGENNYINTGSTYDQNRNVSLEDMGFKSLGETMVVVGSSLKLAFPGESKLTKDLILKTLKAHREHLKFLELIINNYSLNNKVLGKLSFSYINNMDVSDQDGNLKFYNELNKIITDNYSSIPSHMPSSMRGTTDKETEGKTIGIMSNLLRNHVMRFYTIDSTLQHVNVIPAKYVKCERVKVDSNDTPVLVNDLDLKVVRDIMQECVAINNFFNNESFKKEVAKQLDNGSKLLEQYLEKVKKINDDETDRVKHLDLVRKIMGEYITVSIGKNIPAIVTATKEIYLFNIAVKDYVNAFYFNIAKRLMANN